MELEKIGAKPKPSNEVELLKLASQEFIKVMTNIASTLKVDIDKLTTIQKEKEKEIIINFNRRLEFLESYKKDEELSKEMKMEIYNDFNKAADSLGNYQIKVYNDNQKEKIVKQVTSGVVSAVTIATLGGIVVALIKKIK
jgi:hypothetical protein